MLSHQVQEFHILGDFVYFYDLWSNIHYGYVGTAAGFSESELLDGAGAEQFVSTLIKGKLPKKTARGLRGWDDIPDRTSVAIGIELYKKDAKTISELDLLKKIEGPTPNSKVDLFCSHEKMYFNFNYFFIV